MLWWSRFGRAIGPAHLLLLVTLPLFVGCARVGDFGRVEHVAIPPPDESLATGSVAVSLFPLTDEEQQLRALAQNLLTAPAEQARTPSWMGDSDAGRNGPEHYVNYLASGPFRSAAARYSRLVDDTRNDITRLEPFFMAARRVADLDMKRARSLAHISTLTQDDWLNAKRRIRENMMLIAEVRRVMGVRAAMYRRALERLVVTLPSPMAVEAERQRLELERRLAAIEVFAAGPQGSAVALEAPGATITK